MPFVPNMDEDQQNPNAQGAVAPAGGGAVHLAPSSGVGSAGPAGAAATPAGGAGGQFATLDKYMTANQGQAAPLADKITSGIQGQYNTLSGQNDSTLSGINSQVSANALPGNTNDIIAQEAANPVSFANDAGNANQFKSLLNATYNGPASAESDPGYQTQQAAVNNAITTGQQQTGSEAGRAQLLQQNEAVPENAGVTALNGALLTQDPTAQSRIENAYQPFNNLVTGLSSGAAGIDKTIADQQANTASANTAANNAITGQVSGMNTAVNNELNAAQGQYNAYNTAAAGLGSALQSGDLSKVPGVDTGLRDFITNNINPWVAQYAPGQTPSYNYANAIPQMPAVAAPTMSNAATKQDLDTYNALNTLSGTQQASPLSGVTLGTPFAAPNIPTVDNKVLAGDVESELQSMPEWGNVGTPVYAGENLDAANTFSALVNSLQQYQGIPVTNRGPYSSPYTTIA